jgi:XRE family transcriptional regulator, regulator of sulfur utilization
MEQLDRRGLFAALSALAALGATGAKAAEGGTLSSSKVFKFGELPVRKFPNGGEQRRVVDGTLTTGEFIEVHETMLPAGETPHPPHKHPNSELVFLQTGNVEFIDDDGAVIPAGPGDIIFTASNRLHGLRNVGGTAATYIVVSVGKQVREG